MKEDEGFSDQSSKGLKLSVIYDFTWQMAIICMYTIDVQICICIYV